MAEHLQTVQAEDVRIFTNSQFYQMSVGQFILLCFFTSRLQNVLAAELSFGELQEHITFIIIMSLKESFVCLQQLNMSPIKI